MTVTDAVNRARVALARDLLGQTRMDMERVAEYAGFASARHMRRVGRRFHPPAPAEARRVGTDVNGSCPVGQDAAA